MMKPPTAEKTLWVDGQYVTQCASCETKFSMFLRKHHCRHCGQIFCYKCLTTFGDSMWGAVKVCHTCRDILLTAGQHRPHTQSSIQVLPGNDYDCCIPASESQRGTSPSSLPADGREPAKLLSGVANTTGRAHRETEQQRSVSYSVGTIRRRRSHSATLNSPSQDSTLHTTTPAAVHASLIGSTDTGKPPRGNSLDTNEVCSTAVWDALQIRNVGSDTGIAAAPFLFSAATVLVSTQSNSAPQIQQEKRIEEVNKVLGGASVKRSQALLNAIDGHQSSKSLSPTGCALHEAVWRCVQATTVGLGRSVLDHVQVMVLHEGDSNVQGPRGPATSSSSSSLINHCTALVNSVALPQSPTSKRMATDIRHPRILLLAGGFALAPRQYESVAEAVSSQEGHFDKLFERIRVWRPDVIVVEKGMHYNLQHRIAASGTMTLLLNVGSQALHRLAAGCGASVIPSLQYVGLSDLQDESALGSCQRFTVQTLGRACRFSTFSGLAAPMFSCVACVLKNDAASNGAGETASSFEEGIATLVSQAFQSALVAQLLLGTTTTPAVGNSNESNLLVARALDVPPSLIITRAQGAANEYSRRIETLYPFKDSSNLVYAYLSQCCASLDGGAEKPHSEAFLVGRRRVDVAVRLLEANTRAASPSTVASSPIDEEDLFGHLLDVSRRLRVGAVPFKRAPPQEERQIRWPCKVLVTAGAAEETAVAAWYVLNLSLGTLLHLLIAASSADGRGRATTMTFRLAYEDRSASGNTPGPVEVVFAVTPIAPCEIRYPHLVAPRWDSKGTETDNSGVPSGGRLALEVAELLRDLDALATFLLETASTDDVFTSMSNPDGKSGVSSRLTLKLSAAPSVAQTPTPVASQPPVTGSLPVMESLPPPSATPAKCAAAHGAVYEDAWTRLETARHKLGNEVRSLVAQVRSADDAPTDCAALCRFRREQVLPLLVRVRRWFSDRATEWEERARRRVPTPLPYPRCMEHDHYVLVDGSDRPLYPREPSSMLALALDRFRAETGSALPADEVQRRRRGTYRYHFGKAEEADGGGVDAVRNGSGSLLTAFSVELLFPKEFTELFASLAGGNDDETAGVSLVESLSRCEEFATEGGRTRQSFYITRDRRFLLKSIKPIEYQQFRTLGPQYFAHVRQTATHCALAKLFAVGSIHGSPRRSATTAAAGASLLNLDVQYYAAMETLAFAATASRSPAPRHVYDLKGSQRNRVAAPGQQVRLDTDLRQRIDEGWGFLLCTPDAKKRLMETLARDTDMLARQSIMDYSLLVSVTDRGTNDRSGRYMDVGLVDYLHPYTGAKVLESKVKSGLDTMLGGGGGADPTIIDPQSYRARFLHWVDVYICGVPPSGNAVHSSN